jgi:hypothetical protein
MMVVLKSIVLLSGLFVLAACEKRTSSLVDYIEVNTGFKLDCSDEQIRIQQPVEFLKIGSVKLSRSQFQPPTSEYVEMTGSLLPYFHIYADRVTGPDADRLYEKWSGKNDGLGWCVAFDPIEKTLWFALDYED